jgi:hypothetical protein
MENYPIIESEYIEKYNKITPNWGYNGLGYVVFSRTYSRSKGDGTYETWPETIARVLNGAQSIGAEYSKEELHRLFNYIFDFKACFGGRILWMLGSEQMLRYGGNACTNCFGCKISSIEDFCYMFENLMLGGGVGFSIRREDIHELPKVKTGVAIAQNTNKDADFIVPDSREGWVELLRKVLTAYLVSGKGFSYSTLVIRGYGEPIKGFGGTASGSPILVKGIDSICKVLSSREGKKLRSIDVLDICNLISSIVVAGNVRRCLAKDTIVQTNHGNKYIQNIKVGDYVFTRKGYKKVLNNFYQGKQAVVKVIFSNGSYLYCTSNHKLATVGKNDEIIWKKVDEIDCLNDTLIGNNEESLEKDPSAYFYKSYFYGVLCSHADYKFKNFDARVLNRCKKYAKTCSDPLLKDIFNIVKTKQNIPDFILNSRNSTTILGFLAGIVDCNGEAESNIILKHSKNPEFLSNIVLICSLVGISTEIKGDSVILYQKQSNKNSLRHLNELLLIMSFTVDEEEKTKYIPLYIDEIENQEVPAPTYDLEVEEEGSFYANGVLVHNSATMAIGDADDYLYLRAKRWDLGNIPNHRSMSNNSLVIDDYSYISDEVWRGYEGKGEPYGFINFPLCRTQGRLGEYINDDRVDVINPCGEIPMSSEGEICCLSELNLNNIPSKEELIDCAKLLYKAQKAICAMNFLHERTNKVVHRNFRIGISVSGVCQSIDKLDWLDECYRAVKTFDREWSKHKNWPNSIKISTIKPSGTLSLLSGATPGIHPAFGKYYIRRVRFDSNDRMVKLCQDTGYQTEYQINFDGSLDRNTIIVQFPCYAGDNVITADEMSAVKQLELVKHLQTIWADNSISVSVSYTIEELPAIKEWLKDNYKDGIKTVSFILKKDAGFKQLPIEVISKEKYDELISKVKPLTSLYVGNSSQGISDIEECKGACPIK